MQYITKNTKSKSGNKRRRLQEQRDKRQARKAVINLFSLEILIGLIAGIFIGWVLKNIFSKKENVGDLASNLKSLEDTVDGFQPSSATERGSIKTILQD